MWGFYNSRDRNLSNYIFSLFTDPYETEKYNNNKKNLWGFDQMFLKDKVYQLIKNKSIIHDSYNCYRTGFLGTPFPTRRLGNYYVGKKWITVYNNTFYTCPENCRPKNNQNWTTC